MRHTQDDCLRDELELPTSFASAVLETLSLPGVPRLLARPPTDAPVQDSAGKRAGKDRAEDSEDSEDSDAASDIGGLGGLGRGERQRPRRGRGERQRARRGRGERQRARRGASG